MPPQPKTKSKIYTLQPEHQARFGEWRDRGYAVQQGPRPDPPPP